MQVKSNACTEEFPDNASNKFKNRLPNVLVFRELGWKVEQYHITDVQQEIEVQSDEVDESVLVSIHLVRGTH